MTAHATMSHRRFARDADRACLGGVCAGFANYFGVNLRVTRILVVIAFFVAMPITVLVYIAMVLLVPAESRAYATRADREFRRKQRRMSRRERKLAAEEATQRAAEAVNQRCQSLDKRLARIEKYVTSSRYNLDREIRNL
jgi:phage shock protein C